MRRLERAVSAAQTITALGLTPKAVEPSILFPLPDAASLATDDSLKSKWDALPANAADPTVEIEILPAYTEILRQLTPLQAQMLDWIYDSTIVKPKSSNIPKIYLFRRAQREDILKHFHIETPQYNILASDLHRLRLIEGGHMNKAPRSKRLPSIASTYYEIDLTHLGKAFIQSCRRPSPGRREEKNPSA